MDDTGFWQDVIIRHELLDQTPEQLFKNERALYNHCLGNFWGMIYQEMIERGYISVR